MEELINEVQSLLAKAKKRTRLGAVAPRLIEEIREHQKHGAIDTVSLELAECAALTLRRLLEIELEMESRRPAEKKIFSETK